MSTSTRIVTTAKKDGARSWSQSGEDLVLRRIFRTIGEGGRVCVEFGAADGTWFSNTKLFREAGWRSWLFDIEPKAPEVVRADIRPDNVNEIFDEHGVPEVIDLLSIDVDGMDIWIFEALKRRARVAIIEYNHMIPPGSPLAVPYPGVTTRIKPEGGGYFPYYGASPSAIAEVGRKKGMVPLATVGVNVILCCSRVQGFTFSLPKQSRVLGKIWKGISQRKWFNVKTQKTVG